MEKNSALDVQQLVKSYGGRRVVDGLSFRVHEGEIVGLLGPNGAGKTTAFYMTVGLIRPDEGQVFFKQEDATWFPMHKRARMGMGYLAQEPSVFRNLTVEQKRTVLTIVDDLIAADGVEDGFETYLRCKFADLLGVNDEN